MGEPGDGGELACEDLGVLRAESVKELKRRCPGMTTAGADTSLGPSTPVLTSTLSWGICFAGCGDSSGAGAARGGSFVELLRCSLLRTYDPTRLPSLDFSGVPDCSAVPFIFRPEFVRLWMVGGRSAEGAGAGTASEDGRAPESGCCPLVMDSSWRRACEKGTVTSLVGVMGSGGSLAVSALSSSSGIARCCSTVRESRRTSWSRSGAAGRSKPWSPANGAMACAISAAAGMSQRWAVNMALSEYCAVQCPTVREIRSSKLANGEAVDKAVQRADAKPATTKHLGPLERAWSVEAAF